jgi:PBP1b-binding outer membrane lipoprotein LpoB
MITNYWQGYAHGPIIIIIIIISAFFLEGCRGKRTPKHFVNLTGESKNFKMLEFPLNQLQTYFM